MNQLLRFIGPKNTVGRDTKSLGDFYTVRVPEDHSRGLCQAQWFFESALGLGLDLGEPGPLEMWITAEEESAGQKLAETVPGDGPLVVICPGSDRSTRRWFPSSFAQAGRLLKENFSARLVVAGAPSDEAMVDPVLKGFEGTGSSWMGKTSIGSLAAAIGKADLLLCNNSLPMHLAAAVNTPCVVVAASGNIVLDRPLVEQGKLSMLHKPLDCSPCYTWECEREEKMLCMERISVEEVVAAASKFLKKKS